MLRVISGKYRHRKLEQPPLEITRPTTDKNKEAIFNSIRMYLPGTVVLDLCCGSGSLSIEALSNGACKAIGVEKNHISQQVILKNIQSLNIENFELAKTDVLTFLATKAKSMKFDFIFFDAPFKDYDLINDTLKSIANIKCLTRNGLLIMETNDLTKVNIPEEFSTYRYKQYGKSHILWLTLMENV
ncbi:16S rRNA (guanine(966)-N(2))-methyltransferase RsmD [Mycoplasmopsis hyopharyngis]|uniref:16S rRNA (guanine(966)-N(2))-methyltransferase RsmD n=1 Tax=Mycoplasmopsis hyopharyngis TaxID=29558 RepID=UPI0038739BFF